MLPRCREELRPDAAPRLYAT